MDVTLDGLNKWGKRAVALTSDIIMTAIAIGGAKWLSETMISPRVHLSDFIIVMMLQCSMYLSCGLYRGVWRFASIPDLIRILRAVTLGLAIIFLFAQYKAFYFDPKIYITYLILLLILLSAPRLLYRWHRDYRKLIKDGKKVLVVGAGEAGESLIRDLQRSLLDSKFTPVGFVDNDVKRIGCEIHGIRVLGPCKNISQLVKKYKIELIIIAIPSASSMQMREIVGYCEKANVPFRTLPGLKDITDGKVSITSLREVSLKDLLGREQVNLDWQEIKEAVYQKNILVTGGGGSIGSELCRQICRLSPSNLIIIDHNEYNLYAIDLDLKKTFSHVNITSHLCSVTDKIEMAKIFQSFKPELVFHAAAYKHVPLLEKHLRVAMYNNIIGTRITAKLADLHGVNTFVLISTDKAVNPANIMGATKRASEVFCQNFNLYSSTKFTTVRFGNVLESTGSVIPLFRKQLMSGGPITVTHPQVTRYFMTIPEATQLILQAATMNKKGEIFVLDMGEPINIHYLAKQMIKLSGKVVGKDIAIEYIGLRPGEKLHEELFHQKEQVHDTDHPKIKRANTMMFNWARLNNIIDEIEAICQEDNEHQLKQLLNEIVEHTETEEHQQKQITNVNDFSYA